LANAKEQATSAPAAVLYQCVYVCVCVWVFRSSNCCYVGVVDIYLSIYWGLGGLRKCTTWQAAPVRCDAQQLSKCLWTQML